MAKATKAFRLFDAETAKYVQYRPGDTVPKAHADRVGDHVLDGKPARRTTKQDEKPEGTKPDGDQGGEGADTKSDA